MARPETTIKKCQRYKLNGTRERNRQRRLNRHLARHPDDIPAIAALARAKRLSIR